MDLVVATRNQGKLKEIRRLLEGADVRVLSLDEFPDLPEVEEDGETFSANARKKAETVARLTGRLTLADDSGLTVEALGGEPGVHSARYAGPGASDEQNNRKLLKVMEGLAPSERAAAFVCVMALCAPGGECRFFDGRLDGEILDAPRGNGGFGYDPLFRVAGDERTLAELPMEAKNAVSHRGQALRKTLDHLRQSSPSPK